MDFTQECTLQIRSLLRSGRDEIETLHRQSKRISSRHLAVVHQPCITADPTHASTEKYFGAGTCGHGTSHVSREE